MPESIENSTYDSVFKYVIIGSSGVGKTSITNQFAKNEFNSNENFTIGVEFIYKFINVNDKKFKIVIWDTAGQERFRAMTKNFYRYTSCCFLVFDVTNRTSFNDLVSWRTSILENIDKNYLIYLIGNKIDRSDRVISYDEARKYAEINNIKYFETSAKDNIGIMNCFADSAFSLYNSHSNNTSTNRSFSPDHKKYYYNKNYITDNNNEFENIILNDNNDNNDINNNHNDHINFNINKKKCNC